MTNETHVLDCLRYFSFFKHPLTHDEIHRYLGVKLDLDHCNETLMHLVSKGKVVSFKGYYALSKSHIDIRIANDERNRRFLIIGKRVGRFLAFFPFVRGVYISGSLSKNGLDGVDDDIDFFIITKPNRLWTARFFLILFKKTILLNSKKYFCVNFFKSESDLVFSKQNRYIATEAMSLIPVVNHSLLEKMFECNIWIRNELPNAKPKRMTCSSLPFKIAWLEFLLRGKMGDGFEDKMQAMFVKYQSKKYNHNESSDIVATKTTSALFPNSVERELMSYWRK